MFFSSPMLSPVLGALAACVALARATSLSAAGESEQVSHVNINSDRVPWTSGLTTTTPLTPLCFIGNPQTGTNLHQVILHILHQLGKQAK